MQIEFWNTSTELVRVGVASSDPQFSEFPKASPFGLLQEIVCQKSYGGVGIVLKEENGLILVSKVFANSPAERAGILLDDAILAIDNQPVKDLTVEQTVERVRGAEKSSVTFKVLRKGKELPTPISILRERIIPVLTGAN